MRFIKIGAVIIGAIIITALGIDAADTLQGSKGTLLSQVIGTESTGVCPDGMVEVPTASTFMCVDAYEVSALPACPRTNPASIIETEENMQSSACGVASAANAEPWTSITREQAMQMCARSGKRLPTAAEWYFVSLGHIQSDAACNIDSGARAKTGSSESCVSGTGTYDMVGNVWEWVSDDVINGEFNNRTLPETGYVGQVDGTAGIATLTGDMPQTIFEKDYFWSKSEGAYGIIRGGYFDSGEDAGVYSIHADTLPTTAGTAIGFRCVL